jgi:hypothetical protein
MKLMPNFVLTLGCVVVASHAANAVHGRDAAAAGRQSSSRDSAARSVLAARDRDTVYLLERSDSRDTLLWVSRRGGARVQYVIPQRATKAVLFDFSGDDVLDLAIYREDEVLDAKLFLGGPGRAELVFNQGAHACRSAELSDVNGDGRRDIVEHIASAVPAEICQRDPKRDHACLPQLKTEWDVVWIQSPDGHFRSDSTAATAFYRDVSREYAKAASRLRRYMAPPGTARPSECRSVDADAMDRMAVRAANIARLGDPTFADPPLGLRDSASRTVFTASGGDTVYVLDSPDFRDTLMWVSRRAGVRAQHAFQQPATTAKLLDLNGDGVLDLAILLNYEEMLDANVFLGGPSRADRVFKLDAQACFTPEFADVTGDGRLDIVEYISAAIPHEMCELYSKHDNLCLPDLPTEWAVVWTQSTDGHFRNDSTLAAPFYRELSRTYAQGAKQFRQHMAPGSSARESLCTYVDVNVMDWMAIRAANIARLGGR